MGQSGECLTCLLVELASVPSTPRWPALPPRHALERGLLVLLLSGLTSGGDVPGHLLSAELCGSVGSYISPSRKTRQPGLLQVALCFHPPATGVGSLTTVQQVTENTVLFQSFVHLGASARFLPWQTCPREHRPWAHACRRPVPGAA